MLIRPASFSPYAPMDIKLISTNLNTLLRRLVGLFICELCHVAVFRVEVE